MYRMKGAMFVIVCFILLNGWSYAQAESQKGELHVPSPSQLTQQDHGKVFLDLTDEQWRIQNKIKKDMSHAEKGCTLVCTGCVSVCVPGCDPPNEYGTVTGCSSCYSQKIVCKECHKECK